MGERLLKYYSYTAQKGGLLLQMKLAMKTRLASDKARAVPDSPENIELFRTVLRELLPNEPEIPQY
jgi:hypothetical protein